MLIRTAKLWLLGLVCAAFSVACHSSPKGEEGTKPGSTAEAKPMAEVSVSDVSRFIKDKRAIVLDANDKDTRKEYGVVPGAVLLAGHNDYELSVLPAAKQEKLVFYCGGTQCRASDKAAARAAAAGYSDVNVMRAGIRGWKEAGLATNPPPQS